MTSPFIFSHRPHDAKAPYYNKFRKAWKNMHGRCYTATTNRYDRYGGRGIAVCAKWHEFDNFYDDMYDSFAIHASLHDGDTQLDRIDNDGHYCPSNCRWLTRKQNNVHRGWISDRPRDLNGHVIKLTTRIVWENEKQLKEAKNKAKKHKNFSAFIRYAVSRLKKK